MPGTENDPSVSTADVCIVGGGPAGLTLALLLLRSGLRVTVAESSTSWHREYRGEILQPGGQLVLDDLGVLEGARGRGSHRLRRFRLANQGRTLLDIDYSRLPPPFDHMLSMPQEHLLRELLDACQAQPGFTYRDGHRVHGLVRGNDGTVRGAVLRRGTVAHTVRAVCVVGADGRHSKTRRLAGLEEGERERFSFDVLWLKIRATGDEPAEVTIARGPAGPVLSYPSHPDRLQIGWALPRGSYPALAAGGVTAVRDALCRVAPGHAAQIHDEVHRLSDLSLLDVFAARTARWSKPGVVLIGDAAHTHSPLGAQGINLAVQDAALLHPTLVAAVAAGEVTPRRLRSFEEPRTADITAVMRFQRIQAGAMMSGGGLAAVLRPRIAGLVQRTPVGTKITRRIAFGNPAARVRPVVSSLESDR
ncbi:FAD-dependent monooxygenase [Micromonospora sp. PTRAS2]